MGILIRIYLPPIFFSFHGRYKFFPLGSILFARCHQHIWARTFSTTTKDKKSIRPWKSPIAIILDSGNGGGTEDCPFSSQSNFRVVFSGFALFHCTAESTPIRTKRRKHLLFTAKQHSAVLLLYTPSPDSWWEGLCRVQIQFLVAPPCYFVRGAKCTFLDAFNASVLPDAGSADRSFITRLGQP